MTVEAPICGAHFLSVFVEVKHKTLIRSDFVTKPIGQFTNRELLLLF